MTFRYIKILVSGLILAILLYSFVDIDFGLVTSKLSVEYIPQIIFLLAISIWLRAYRWQILMNDDGLQKMSIGYSLNLLLVGQALNMIMPSGAGDVAKSYFGYKATGVKERMFSVSLYDKIIAIASIGLMGIFSVFYTKQPIYVLFSAISIVPMVLIILFPYISQYAFVSSILNTINERFKRVKIGEILSHLKFSNRTIFLSLIISVLAWVITYWLLYLCFLSFGLSIKSVDVLVYSPILTLARLFPLTLNGLGSDELLIVYLFNTHTPTDKGLILIASIYYRLILIILPALPGVLYMLKKDPTKEDRS
jgi:uncharacterized protein (TIRG00374 family)